MKDKHAVMFSRIHVRPESEKRVACLIADLEMYERFWYYLARFQVSGVFEH